VTWDENVDLARKVFKLSQTVSEPTRRQLVEIMCLNFRLDGVTLIPERRKPFDVPRRMASGLIEPGREESNLGPPGPDQIEAERTKEARR
jgi:hypothetical protein